MKTTKPTTIITEIPLKNGQHIVHYGITAQNDAEKKLEQSEERYRTLIERVSEAFIALDKNWRYTYVNKQAGELTHRDPESLIGKNVWDEFPDAIGSATYEAFNKAMREQRYVCNIDYYSRLDIWHENHIYPSPDGLSVFIRDITERKKAEEKLEKKTRELLHSESRLKQAQAIAHVGNWEVNFATNISKWSDEAYRIYGLSPAEHQLSMEAWMSFIHPEDLDEVKKEIERSQASLSDSSFYHRIIRKDGVIRYVLSESKFEFDKEGKPIGLYGIVHDITDRKNNEQELKDLNEQIIKRAEELAVSNAELERFAYVASHDLQEPLRMVNSFLQLLQKKYKGQLDETAEQYIGYAVDGALRMKKLILDLLEYSRIGTNKDVLSDTGINEVAAEVLEIFSSKISETNAVIKVQPMPVVKAIKTQVSQLLQNLLSNALKYNTSPVPEIEIGCEEKSNAWQFYVKDNGIGIEQKFLDKVFIIFQRLHNKNQFSGTGIGLAICKKIAERHGGTIWIESQPGTGSVFFFTIKK